MKKHKKIILWFIKISLVIIIDYLLFFYIGNKYIKSLNAFISQNSSISIKKGINNIILNNKLDVGEKLYIISYNDKKEITNLSLNINEANRFLGRYLDLVNDSLEKLNNSYLTDYYDSIKIKDRYYYLFSLGILTNNPFLYNFGPKIIMTYDYINTPFIKISVDVKNYGINNALCEVYLIINIKQSVLKPIIKDIKTMEYKFLISSEIINGRISNYLGTNLNLESDYISN